MAEDLTGILKEIRDSLKEDLLWRRKVIEESLSLQKKAVFLQRLGFLVLFLLVVAAGILFLARQSCPARAQKSGLTTSQAGR